MTSEGRKTNRDKPHEKLKAAIHQNGRKVQQRNGDCEKKKVEKPEMKSSVSQTQSTKKPINQAEEKNIKDV